MSSPPEPHTQPSHLPPHILYQNPSKTITLIDIPRSIEDAQYLSEEDIPHASAKRRLISCEPVDTPYPSLEPKSKKALKNAPEKSIKELMLERYAQLALEEMREGMKGGARMCLDRVVGKSEKLKRKRKSFSEELEKSKHNVIKVENVDCMVPKRIKIDRATGIMPPKSTMIHGNICETSINIDASIESQNSEGLPSFHVIIADPPWPNRSALRKDAYATASGSLGMANLLRSLPCHHIEPNGYVGIWITNKPAFHAMLLDEGGLFDHWGLEIVEEWIWLKITSSGEPIYEIPGTWRKPWEILLVGRQKGAKRDPREGAGEVEVKRRGDGDFREEFDGGLVGLGNEVGSVGSLGDGGWFDPTASAPDFSPPPRRELVKPELAAEN